MVFLPPVNSLISLPYKYYSSFFDKINQNPVKMQIESTAEKPWYFDHY